MNIAHIALAHKPLDGRIFQKQSISLIKAGHQVTIISSTMPPDTEVFGVQFVQVPQHVPRRRIYTYRLARSLGADVYHIHEPYLIPIGVALRLRAKVIYDAHEDSPQQALSNFRWLSLRGRIKALLQSIRWRAYEWLAKISFNRIVAATPLIAKKFPRKKTHLVQNFPIAISRKDADLTTPYMQRERTVVYAGGLLQRRCVTEMVEAVGLVKPPVRLILAGSFTPPELELEVRRLPGWHRTTYLGWVSRQKIDEIYAQARVGLVIFHPVPNHIGSQPTKLFEYMAAGLPVITADFPPFPEFVTQPPSGILVDSFNVQAITDAIQWLLDNPTKAKEMGEAGRRKVENLYSWQAEERELLAAYRTLDVSPT